MNLPTFTVARIFETDGEVELVGVVSSTVYQGQGWIGENWIGYIGRPNSVPISGRWFAEKDGWKFITEHKSEEGLREHETFCVYDGYWGERAYIVLSPLIWTPEAFIAAKQDDHDHCGICWETIFADAPSFFRSSEGDIVCPSCYKNYVVTHSTSFLKKLA